jgi:hypothetical protein
LKAKSKSVRPQVPGTGLQPLAEGSGNQERLIRTFRGDRRGNLCHHVLSRFGVLLLIALGLLVAGSSRSIRAELTLLHGP